MGEKTREEIIRSIRKEMMGCVQALVGKKKCLVQFKYGKIIYTINCSIVLVCSKEEFVQGVKETISDLPKKHKGGLLTIEWGTVD